MLDMPGAGKGPARVEAAPAAVPGLVLTIGTFDLLHYGHVAFLRQCARLGGQLVVGVSTGQFASSFKRRPVMSERERCLAVSQLGYETYLSNSAGRELIDLVRPAVLAVGSDWARKDYYAQVDVTQDWLDEREVILAYVPYTRGISTTEIIRRVAAAG